MPTAAASLLARLVRRRRPVARRQEPADMGTAFGMEQWLDECEAAPAARADRRWLPQWLRPVHGQVAD